MGLCLAGRISAEVALARLLLGGETAAGIGRELDARRPEPPNPRWEAMRRLLDGHAAALDRLAAEIAETGGDHSGHREQSPSHPSSTPTKTPPYDHRCAPVGLRSYNSPGT